MQVFKLYFKLLKGALPSLVVYVFIFLGLTVISTLNSKNNDVTVFNESKVDIAFINKDEDSELIKGFKEYLTKSCNIVEGIKNEEESLQDALFFRRVEYIVTIPEGFTKDFLNGQVPTVEKLTVPDSTRGTFVDISINNYLGAAKAYRNTMENMTEKEIVETLKQVLDTEVTVNMFQGTNVNHHNSKRSFFLFLSYGTLSTVVLGIGLIMLSFQDLDLKRRNVISPISNMSIHLQQFLGNMVFTIVSTLILIVCGLALVRELSIDRNTVLFIINAFVFSMSALSIAFLVGITVKTTNAINAICNVIALGLSFVSGIFVPQELLGTTAINIAKFTPSYWYVNAIDEISGLTKFNMDTLFPIFKYMLIQIGFAVALLAIALVISKKNNTREC